MRCFIVDDSPDFVSSARDMLRRQGVTFVGSASNGAEALFLASRVEADVALVDVGLGEESGIDVARALTGADKRLRVIMISASAEADLKDLLADSRALGFLQKASLSRTAIDGLLRAEANREND